MGIKMGVYQDLKQGSMPQTLDDFGLGELDLDADVAALNGDSSEDKFSDLSKIARDAAALASESSMARRQPDAAVKDRTDYPYTAGTYKPVSAADSSQPAVQSDDAQLADTAIIDTAVIIEGMDVNGDISSTGNMNLYGNVTGDIEILGKLKVTGTIKGNTYAAEVYAESAQIHGEIKGEKIVKIGENSIVIGNISSANVVIAGAVKGDIDVNGPVILDSSAVVMGNIKSKSMQINSGAVIEGMCSQLYADVSVKDFFEKNENKGAAKEDSGNKETESKNAADDGKEAIAEADEAEDAAVTEEPKEGNDEAKNAYKNKKR